MDISLLWRAVSTWVLGTGLAAFAYGARHWFVSKPSGLTAAELWRGAGLAAIGSLAVLVPIYGLSRAAEQSLPWAPAFVLTALVLLVSVPAAAFVFMAAFRLSSVRDGLVVLGL